MLGLVVRLEIRIRVWLRHCIVHGYEQYDCFLQVMLQDVLSESSECSARAGARAQEEEQRTKTKERSQSVRQEVNSPNLACMQGCVGGGIWFLREACFRKLVPEIAPVQLLFFQPLPQPPALRNATCSACTIQATSCDQCEANMSPVP